MIADAVLGATYGFGAALQPGPLQTYLAAEALAHGWRRTLPVALAPLLSDGPIVAFVLLVLAQAPPALMSLLRVVGGGFLLYLSVRAFSTWRQGPEARTGGPDTAPRSLIEAVIVNLLNPNPYLAWSLVLGPLTLAAWRRSPWDGIALIGGFYGTMVIVLAGLVGVFARAGDVGPRTRRALTAASAAALAALGVYQVWTGTRDLTPGIHLC